MKTAFMLLSICACFGVTQAQPQGKVVYFTEYGPLTFNFKAKNVSGEYEHDEGRIAAVLKDSLATGTWKQSSGGGDLAIQFNPDFSKFKIRYNHAATRDSTGAIWKKDWTGMRKPASLTRRYQTPYGVMTLEFLGSQVQGNYPWYNGQIMGEIKGNEFMGLWLQGNGGVGNFKIKFAPDFSSFEGQYNDYNYHSDKWFRWNGKLLKN